MYVFLVIIELIKYYYYVHLLHKEMVWLYFLNLYPLLVKNNNTIFLLYTVDVSLIQSPKKHHHQHHDSGGKTLGN